MTDISLITSLYQSDRFLAKFSEHVIAVATQVAAHGIALEFVFVPNDASPTERELLRYLTTQLEAIDGITTQVLHIPREKLYASWNRGVRASQGKIFGFWNVDDVRTAKALVEAHILAQSGEYDLIDFPVEIYTVSENHRFIRSNIYDPINLQEHQMVLGTFFMATHALFDKVGGFDTDYRVTGDVEWSVNPIVRQSRFINGTSVGGTFTVHDTSLSQNHDLRLIEENVVFLRYGQYHLLNPANPVPMREAWETWGNRDKIELPESIKNWLWGAKAKRRYKRYYWEKSLPRVLRRGLLAMARRGWVYSADWDVHQNPKA